MGSGASQPQNKATEESASSKPKGRPEPLLEKSPFDDIGTAGNILEHEIGSDDGQHKAVASATKLKRMAFGQQTYMDQQRDYDHTLAKLDLNKSGVVDWVDPGSVEKGSPSKNNGTPKGTPSTKMKFPDLSPTADAKSSASTPDGAKRVVSRKPPPPSVKPSPSTSIQPGAQQVVQAPNRPLPHQQAQFFNRMSPNMGTDSSPPSNSSTLVDGLSGLQSAHGHSFSQAPQQKGVYAQPNHYHSENQLVNRAVQPAGAGGGLGAYGASPTLSAGGNGGGPPAGLISRPFPGHHQPVTQSMGATTTDPDDSMIADFSRSSVKVDTFKKPDNVPILIIHNAVPSDASVRTKLPSVAGAVAGPPVQMKPGNMQQPVNPYLSPAVLGRGGNTPVSCGSTPAGSVHRPQVMHHSPAAHGAAPGLSGSGPGTPAAGAGPGPGSGMVTIQPVRPMTMGTSGAVPPSGIAPSPGSGMRPAPAPVPHGAAMMTAPVVKETKNVKRNRAQIPTQLAHALPTTGDWMNKRYIVNNYILLEILGTGSYGEVRSSSVILLFSGEMVCDLLFVFVIIS